MASIEEKNLIIEKNLRENDRQINVFLEKRVAHISDLADLVIGSEEEDMRDTYLRSFAPWKKDGGCIDENKKYVASVQGALNLYDKLNCVDTFYPNEKPFFFDTDEESVFESDTVVYLKNPLADIAYNNFTKVLSDARVVYKESFSDVCEEVYYNRAPYCILPVDNSDDGRMTSFSNMIRKYELKIVLTCNVESANGKTTRFALLKRELAVIDCKGCHTEGKYLEIGLNFGEDQKLQDVLQAASFFGFELNKVDSLPIYYSEKEYYFDVVFKGSGELNRFLFWLELEVPRYEVIGIYSQIKTIIGKNGG